MNDRSHQENSVNTSRSRQFMMTIGKLLHKGYTNQTVDCINPDKKSILNSLFLLNSLIISTLGLFLELEWRRRTLYFSNMCAWKTDVLELFIYGISVYFFLLTIISACTAILYIGRIYSFHEIAYELLIFYSVVTGFVCLTALTSYMLTSRFFLERCQKPFWYLESYFTTLQQFEFRIVILTIFGLMASIVYGMTSLSIRNKERRRQQHDVLAENQRRIFHVSCEHPVVPPPPYSQSTRYSACRYNPLRSRAYIETELNS